MLIKSIKLENIRSYTLQEIEFPEGSVMLSGDIGSGKSTILLAIEFALFGIKRKHLSGAALLRNGKNQGSVELKFIIEDKEVIIKRFLKRGKSSIDQISGYTIINGMKKEGTAVELKARIVELLGYPRELVSKSKDMVYRYTVYTPQEEMKQILAEDKDVRMDILRRVFGIDKYKRIRENTMVLTRELKDMRKEVEASIYDLEDKKKYKTEKQEEIKRLLEKIEEIIPELERIKNKVILKKQEVMNFEEKIKEVYRLRKELEVKIYSIKTKKEQRERNKTRIEQNEKSISTLIESIKGKEVTDTAKKIKEKKEDIFAQEKKLREAVGIISALKARQNHSKEIKNKILSIDKCPLCEQHVSKEHKKDIGLREDANIIENEKKLKDYNFEMTSIENKIKLLKKELDVLIEKEKEAVLITQRKKMIEEKENAIKEIKEINEKLRLEIIEAETMSEKLEKQIEEFKDIDNQFSLLKAEIEDKEKQARSLEIKKAGYDAEKKSIERNIEIITKEIEEKENKKKRIAYVAELQNWVENGFINMMGVIEKHVMANVYGEFNELFRKWFELLIEDEAINVRLDDSFAPIVIQNGYEIDIAHLSGGERTAAALAYRLALNKVVNDLMSGIKTKDIIMLDEPTDGFSSEQLDRVRDVLYEIKAKQTIIVSHENKIESFVDNVIKINKSEHESALI